MSRPGSQSAAAFFEAVPDLALWHQRRAAYRTILEKLDQSKKKNGRLVMLDNKIHNDLRTRLLASSDTDFFLSKNDLIDIVEWKLTRGKFRPLMKRVASNDEKTVQKSTLDSFRICKTIQTSRTSNNDWERALDIIVDNLGGVGEATASGILAVVFPDLFPFMADEVIEAVVPETKRDYTRRIYKVMRERLLAKRDELNDLQSSEQASWSVEDVGRAVWCCAMEEVVGTVEVCDDGSSDKKATKRSNKDTNESSSTSTKRRKT